MSNRQVDSISEETAEPIRGVEREEPTSRGCDSIYPYVIVCLLLWGIIGSILLVHRLHSNSDRVFLGYIGSGHHRWVVDDGSLYIDMIEQARNGAWLFANRFSPDMGEPMYLNLVWVVVGKLGRLAGLSPIGSLNAFRFVAILLLVASLRGALRVFVPNPSARSLALVLIIFGGGLGWVFGVAGHWFPPLSPYFIEAHKSEIWTFLAAVAVPHNALAMSMVIWIMTGLALSSKGLSRAIWTAPAVALLLATFHPYDVPILYAVGGVFLIFLRLRDGRINRPLLIAWMGIIALTLPVLAYHYHALHTAPDLKGLLLQNDIKPWSSIRFVIGLFPLGLLAAFRLIDRLADWRNASNSQLLIASWAILLPILLYSYPDVGFAWKLTIAMPLPICVLAVEWMAARPEARNAARPLYTASPLIAAIVVASVLSSAFIAMAMALPSSANRHPYSISRAEYDALQWIGRQPGTEDTVLSGRYLGVFVPRLTHKRPFIGHDHQSVDFVAREQFAMSLFDDDRLSEDELDKLREYRIRWILYAGEEQKWWPDLEPGTAWSLAYDRDGIRVYSFDTASGR